MGAKSEVVDSCVLEAGLLADDFPGQVQIAEAPARRAPRNDPGVAGAALPGNVPAICALFVGVRSRGRPAAERRGEGACL